MMEAAAREATETRVTQDEIIKTIWFAEIVNRRQGGVLVKPWEVNEMPEDWRDMYMALIEAEQKVAADAKVKQSAAKMEHYHADFRRAHPSYRKY